MRAHTLDTDSLSHSLYLLATAKSFSSHTKIIITEVLEVEVVDVEVAAVAVGGGVLVVEVVAVEAAGAFLYRIPFLLTLF